MKRKKKNGGAICRFRKRLPAVYTVEAAIIMMISMTALLALTFLAFYLHDRQSLEAEMSRLVRRAAAEDWMEERLLQEFQQGRGCRLFYLRVREARAVKASLPELGAPSGKRLEAQISFPAPGFLQGWLEEKKRLCWIEKEAQAYRPQEFIRKTEAVKGVAE